MGKVLVFIFNGMTDYEITFCTHLLKTSGDKDIVTISYDSLPIISSAGLTYLPVKLVKDVLEEEVEGLIIPGGWYGELRPELTHLIQRLFTKGKLISGICGVGTVFLAQSGILNQVTYTTPVTEWTEKHIQVFGNVDPFPRENYVLQRVVRDKNVITAQGTAFIDFAIDICDWFNLFEYTEEKVAFRKMMIGY